MDKLTVVVEQLSQQNPFKGEANLPDPPRPIDSAIPRDRPSLEQVPFIQQQISTLTYNHLPRTFFCLEKQRSLQSVLSTAREALTEALPIRCLEATFVALHYTQCLKDIDRIPLSFKSIANGNVYRHIVLVLRTRATPSLYGALGLSRKNTLMYKPMTFRTLFGVVMDYKKEYAVLGHELVDVKLGLAITHDEHSRLTPCWRYVAIKLDRYSGAPLGDESSPDIATRRKPRSNGATLSAKPFLAPRDVALINSSESESLTPPQLHLENMTPSMSQPSAQGVGAPVSESPLTASPSSQLPRTAGDSASVSTVEDYAPLASLLDAYTRLLPTICEQYYKLISSIDTAGRAVKLCFMDLDMAERDAGLENQRRLQCILEMQSPLSPEARRLAANRQLKAPQKERSQVKLASSGLGSGQAAKRRSPGTATTTASATSSSRNGNLGDARNGKRSSPAAQRLVGNGDPKRSPVSTAAAVPRLPPSLSSSPFPCPPLSMTTPTTPFKSHPLITNSTVVDAQSICSGTSAEQTVDSTQDGQGPSQPMGEDLVLPPLTPRNDDVAKPETPYDTFLCTPTSSSDLFMTPRSGRVTMMTQEGFSPSWE